MSHPEEPTFVVRQEPDLLGRRKVMLVAMASALVASSVIAVVAWIIASSPQGLGIAHPAAPAPSQIGTVDTTLILATERGITLRTEQRSSLLHYGWVDRDAGIARIPIERAIELLSAAPPPPDGGSP